MQFKQAGLHDSFTSSKMVTVDGDYDDPLRQAAYKGNQQQ